MARVRNYNGPHTEPTSPLVPEYNIKKYKMYKKHKTIIISCEKDTELAARHTAIHAKNVQLLAQAHFLSWENLHKQNE